MHNTALLLSRLPLLFLSGIVTSGLIASHHFGIWTQSVGNISFLIFLIFLAGLYRPRWVFWFFVGALPLEIINIASEAMEITVRPYQILGASALFGSLVRILTKRTVMRLPQVTVIDILIVLIIVMGFVSTFFAPEGTSVLLQTVIVASFAVLYATTRLFVQKRKHFRKPLQFFLVSSIIVTFYGIVQNILFLNNVSHHEIMPGRINATFAEADWLGVFLVFVIAMLLSVFFYRKDETDIKSFDRYSAFVWGMLWLTCTALILTVARSAWLGVGTVVTIFIILGLWQYGWLWSLRKGIGILIVSIGALICSMPLTSFELGNRAISASSGLQEITIACHDQATLPDVITTEILSAQNCAHIMLEDIAYYEENGAIVTRVFRKDPNVAIRQQIYIRTWDAIKRQWFFGYGWGSSGMILGADATGTLLNASNIFLEIWLSIGIVGLVGFVSVLGILGWHSIVMITKAQSHKERALYIFVILGLIAIIVPNMFNAGLLLGFVWVFLAFATSILFTIRK